jgi:predicted RND superfamily exporter protein
MGLSECVQGAFYNAFYKWGKFVARRPCLVILVSFLIALAGSVRLLLAPSNPLPAIVEQDQLWVPQTAQAVTDKASYDKIFMTTMRRNTLYFTTKPRGGNVLTKSILSEVRRFDMMVTDQLNATHIKAGRNWVPLETENRAMKGTMKALAQYEDVCAQSTMSFGRNLSDPNDAGPPNCVLFGHPLELFYRTGGIFDFDYTDQQILDIVNSGKGIDKTLYPDSSNRTFNVEASYGGVTKDANGKITGATAIAYSYLLDEQPEGSVARDAAIAWEDQLNILIGPKWTDWNTAKDCKTTPVDHSEFAAAHAGGCEPQISQGAAFPGDLRWVSSLIDIFPQTAGATSRELGKNIRGDLLSLNMGFLIILVYAIFVFGRFTPVKSRVLLALSGCASVGFSIAFAYGFTTAIGFKLNPVINVLPFVLIGIGVDDMFVLIAALESTDKNLPIQERMGQAMGRAGVSITVTSLTDLFAFALGSSSQLPALATFCVFAAIGITADFLLQISFFSAFMTLDSMRETKGKVDCCPCCCPPPKQEIESGCCCCLCTYNCCNKFTKCFDGPDGGLKAFMRAYYIPFLRKKWVKGLVIVIFAAWTGVAAFYATKLKQDFQFRWFVNDDAQLQLAFDVQDDYFKATGLPVNVVTPPSVGSDKFDYASIAGQKKLSALATNINANPWIEKDSLSFWYPSFKEWIHECGLVETYDAGPLAGTSCVKRDCWYNASAIRSSLPEVWVMHSYCKKAKELRDTGGNNLEDQWGRDIPGGADLKYVVDEAGSTLPDGSPIGTAFIPPAKFWMWLDQFLADAPLGAIYSSEVVWNVNETVRTSAHIAEGLKATRVRANYKASDKADEQVASMRTLRESVNAAQVGTAFPYMFMYLYYEQYAIIVSEALMNLGLALVAVAIITFIMLANVMSSVLVMLCVVLVDIDILGLMYLWGLTIDSVAIINLVLAIGLAVDYSVHVAHAFVQTPGTRQERVDHALEEMGTAVVHGAFSTFLAVLVLSVSKSYIFRIFFKQFFGICLFGAAHGLCLLPVLLSLIGPAYVATGGASSTTSKAKPVPSLHEIETSEP